MSNLTNTTYRTPNITAIIAIRPVPTFYFRPSLPNGRISGPDNNGACCKDGWSDPEVRWAIVGLGLLVLPIIVIFLIAVIMPRVRGRRTKKAIVIPATTHNHPEAYTWGLPSI